MNSPATLIVMENVVTDTYSYDTDNKKTCLHISLLLKKILRFLLSNTLTTSQNGRLISAPICKIEKKWHFYQLF